MKNNKILTSTKEDYLRAIFKYQSANRAPFGSAQDRLKPGKDSGKIGVTQIARLLNLNKSTVSERLRELMAQKLIKPSFYSSISLTKKGYAIARKLTYKHRLIEVFLNRTLKIPKSRVHNEAHKLEHAFSDSVIKKLNQFIGRPKYDPHGAPIPQI